MNEKKFDEELDAIRKQLGMVHLTKFSEKHNLNYANLYNFIVKGVSPKYVFVRKIQEALHQEFLEINTNPPIKVDE